MAKGEPFRPVRLTTHVVMWFDRCSVADRALVARYTKRKQEAEAEDDQAPPQVRITLELRAGSVIDDAPEERPFGRSRASLGPALAALHATRGRHRATLRGGWRSGAVRLLSSHVPDNHRVARHVAQGTRSALGWYRPKKGGLCVLGGRKR